MPAKLEIPIISDAPGIKKYQNMNHPVSLIDLFPTLAELCGLEGVHRKNEKGRGFGGFSLVPFLEDPQTTDWNGPNGALSMIGVGLDKEEVMNQTYSYRTKDWRYIRYMDVQEELYDHNTDPHEWNNLVGVEEFKDKKLELKQEMFSILAN